MTEYEIIKELYERSMEKIFSMSANYKMTKPKPGCEAAFLQEKDIADWLYEEMHRRAAEED